MDNADATRINHQGLWGVAPSGQGLKSRPLPPKPC